MAFLEQETMNTKFFTLHSLSAIISTYFRPFAPADDSPDLGAGPGCRLARDAAALYRLTTLPAPYVQSVSAPSLRPGAGRCAGKAFRTLSL
jgi:hypothetical protein